MSPFDESSTIQAAISDKLKAPSGKWRYVAGNKLDRSKDSALVESELIAALIRLNPLIEEDPTRVDEILPRLRLLLVSAANEGLLWANEQMTTWLRGTQTHKFVGTESDDYPAINLIDFEKLENNTFIISDEVTFGYGILDRRFDIVLWVNGIPLVVGETKTPVDGTKSWLDGANDIHEVYEDECASFFVPNVFSFATEGREFHYGAIHQNPVDWLMWGSTEDPYDLEGAPRVMRSVELLLQPEQILSILQNFVLFDRPVRDGVIVVEKLVPRYPQVEGVASIHQRVLDPLRHQGLIWHYQGTGKTLLMAFAALELLNDDQVGGPTVLIVLDRIDLVEQTYRQFRTGGLPRMRVAGTREQLRTMLADDHRGIIVTTIFRFKDAGFLNDRENIIALVDEAHRTQEGNLGKDMRKAIPNAQFFGLTGTPIADLDRNTFKLFGDPDDKDWVLNQYSMERSIIDGASVPIHVDPRLVDFHIDKEALDAAFQAMADEEGLTDEERELLGSKAASAKAWMSNPERVRKVCADIVEHYLTKVAPLGMKAQVVAYDRELCVAYHDEIVRLLAERESDKEVGVVMTVGTVKNEPADWRKRFDLTKDAEEKLKGRFKSHNDKLSLLVVTAKLLTGFDAPIEGAMYLDKPLRFHTLFQAITRTNRRWTNPQTGQEKHYGLIVDYVGLGDQIARALRAADPESGGRRPIDVGGLTEEFVALIEAVLLRFEGVDRNDSSFAALMAAQECVPPGEEREHFAADFLRLQMMWEFLFPAEALDDYKKHYRWLAQVYESVKPSSVSDALLWQRLGAKTLGLVHQHISNVVVTGTGLDEVIVDAETVEAIKQLSLPDTSEPVSDEPMTVGEALDTIEARLKKRLGGSGNHRVYKTLSERLEKLRQRQLQQASASIDFLREIFDLAKDVTIAEKAEEEGRLDEPTLLPDPNIGALTQIFREYAPPDAPVIIENVVKDVDSIVRLACHTGWTTSQPGDRTVRNEIRKTLKRHGLPTTGDLFDHAYAYVRENY